jgi:hypothetical protein
LAPSACPVYEENLLYLFYGIPAYRSCAADTQTRMLEYFPVVFLVHPNFEVNVKRILPMDSGGLFHNMYADLVHPEVKKEAFEVPPPLLNVLNIIDFYYGSNQRYLTSNPKADILVRETQFELASVKRLASASGVTRADDRRHTIEIQSGSAVPLDNGSLVGLIAPSQFADEPYFKLLISHSDAICKYYDVEVARPRETHGVILKLAKEILRDRGFS